MTSAHQRFEDAFLMATGCAVPDTDQDTWTLLLEVIIDEVENCTPPHNDAAERLIARLKHLRETWGDYGGELVAAKAKEAAE